MDTRKLWTISIFLFVALGAMTFQLRGPLLSHIQKTFSVSKSLLGLVAPAGTAGFMGAVLTTGMITGRIDTRKFFLIGAGVTPIFIFLMGLSPIYFLFLGFLFTRGIASGLFRGVDRPTLSHLYPDKRGWIYNLHAAAWGVGAASGPLFAILILNFGSWRLAYLLLALAMAPVFFLILWSDPLPKSEGERTPSWGGLRSMGKNPAIIGMIAALIINGGVEGGFFIWFSYYLEQSFSQNVAYLCFSGYLATYVPGRILYSKLSKKTDYTSLVIINSIIGTLFIVGFLLNSGFLAVGCALVVGFLVSGNFPNLITLGTETFPQYSGPVNGLAMTSSAIGIALFPAIIGVLADSYDLQTALWLLVPLMICVATVAILVRITTSEDWETLP